MIEIRKLNKPSEILFMLEAVDFSTEIPTPILKFEKHELYLLYSDKI